MISVETLFRRACCSFVMSLDLVLTKFVFLFLDVDCGIIYYCDKVEVTAAAVVYDKTAHKLL